MEVTKVGSVPYFGKTATGSEGELGIAKSPEHKKINEKNLAIAALAVTSIGLATVALIKKGKAKKVFEEAQKESSKMVGEAKAKLVEALSKPDFKLTQRSMDQAAGLVQTSNMQTIMDDVAEHTTKEAHKIRKQDLVEAFKDFKEAA